MTRRNAAAQIREASDQAHELWRAAIARAGIIPPEMPRWGLGEAVDALAAAARRAVAPAQSAADAAPAAMPRGAQWRWARCDTAFGGRDYRLYRPGSLGAARPAGLVLMLHGCQQNPDGFACATGMNALAERHGLILIYPHQTARENKAGCWNWFRAGDQRRDAGEPGLLAELTRRVALEQDAPHGAIFAVGLSAGGAMATVLGRSYPELYSAVGVHSGLPHGAARDAVGALAAMRRGPVHLAPRNRAAAPAIIFHGDADDVVHPSNGDHIAADAAGADARSEERSRVIRGRRCRRTRLRGPDGALRAEYWRIGGMGHAWSGGAAEAGFADPDGPDASAEMMRFFLARCG